MIFLLDVFLTALLTEGFFFSLIISIFAVLSVDYIFTPPYWNVSFTLSGFPLTFLVTMTISVVTGIVTSRPSRWMRCGGRRSWSGCTATSCGRCPTISAPR